MKTGPMILLHWLGNIFLRTEKTSDERSIAQSLNSIIRSAESASHLTSQLLSFSRKENERSIILDVHRIIEETIDILSHSIDKNIRIQKSFDARYYHMTGDPIQLQNAFLNIALNARDAMPEGGTLSFVTKNGHAEETQPVQTQEDTVSTPESGEVILLHVIDTGKGMDRHTQQHIFEPFFTTKTEGKGTGMGLASVYSTIQNHHGTIRVESEPENGTTFIIELPISKGQHHEELLDRNTPESKKRTGHILFIDDNEVLCQAGAKMLERLGYTVQIHYCGKDAVDYYKKEWRNVDLVILDMIMPDMDGKETFKKLRQINPGIKVLVASGNAIEDNAQFILDAGGKGFIQKPFRISELSEKIAHVLHSVSS